MGVNIAESLQEINNVKLAIKESINQKGGELTNEPFLAYAAKIDSLNTSGGAVDTSKYQVIIHVTNGDGSELAGQIMTINDVEHVLSGAFGEVQIEGAVGDILNLSFSHRDEFYKPSSIMYTIAADVIVKKIIVSYVPIANVVTYGYKITELTADPLTRVEYADDAVGMVKGSAAWDIERIFKEIKPCLFKNGVVVGYLDPNNFEQFEDGTPADITTGLSGDVMIEFPKVAYKMSSVDGVVSASVTNNPDAKSVDSEYSFNAFSRESEGDREHCYIGAYGGWVDTNGKLRSLSGKTPTANKTVNQFRLDAQSNGDGYQQMGFYQLTLLQHLYLIRFGSTDSQSALGNGYTGQTDPILAPSGRTNKLGMTYGVTKGMHNDKTFVKLFGVENIYGNTATCIDGLFFDAQSQLLTSFKDFNDAGVGYTNNGIKPRVQSGNIREVQGSTNTGFIIKTSGGSGYYDGGSLFEGYLPRHGGGYRNNSGAGIFSLSFMLESGKATGTFGADVGARLCYV